MTDLRSIRQACERFLAASDNAELSSTFGDLYNAVTRQHSIHHDALGPWDIKGDHFSTWTDTGLQVASFYWRRPWWELSTDQIETAWNYYLGWRDGLQTKAPRE